MPCGNKNILTSFVDLNLFIDPLKHAVSWRFNWNRQIWIPAMKVYIKVLTRSLNRLGKSTII